MKKYPLMDPKVDFAFKQIFAGNTKESKIVLINLLNAILDLKGDDEIKEIIYLNPYIDKEYDEDKQSIMDIKVKTGKEERIDIEMQIRNVDNYRKRSLYYWSTMYGEQIVDGEAYYNLKKCIVVNIIDYNLLDETEDYHTVFRVMEKDKHFELLEDLELHYLELRKLYEKEDINNLNTLEEWLIFIKDAANEEKAKLIDMIRKKNGVIDMAGEILEKVSQDEKARAVYQQRRKWYLDKVSSEKFLLHKGREEGKEEGIKQGIEQGIKQGVFSVAKNLLSMGMKYEKIKDATGLSIDKIKEIEKKDLQ